MFDHQLYCVGKGLDYPAGDIEGYIDDNKALMRRMYGNLVAEEQPEPEPQVDHRTPASTRPLPEVQFQSRGVRNFAGRFKRDVLEGKLKFIKKTYFIVLEVQMIPCFNLRYLRKEEGLRPKS